MTHTTIAHPTLLAAVVVGVVAYLFWQRSQAQARAALVLPGDTIFGPDLPSGTSTSGSSSGTSPGDVITIGPITPQNIPQPSVSGNFPQASSS